MDLENRTAGPRFGPVQDSASGSSSTDWLRAGVRAVVACSIVALLTVLVCLPLLGGTIMTVRGASEYVDSLPSRLPDTAAPQRSTILAADGSKIADFYSENRLPVSIDKVAPVMQEAIVAIEDSRFYAHHGMDIHGTLRAVLSNVFGSRTQGGSTLTQQYVKNVLLNDASTDQERARVTSRTSYLRKLQEARYAVALEKKTSKKQILQDYLNITYFGDGAYGIWAASRHFFSVSSDQLTLPQAALLAGLAQSPTKYNPVRHPEAALARRNTVLGRMQQLGLITEAERDQALTAPLKLRLSDPRNGCTGVEFAFYCQWVREQLQRDPAFGTTPEQRQERLYRGGMTIHTALVPRDQRIAQTAVDRALGRGNKIAAASVTVQPGTGKVVAMATNRTFGSKRDQTEVLLPTRPAYQPGSNMKPFTLATALEQGYDISTVYNAPYAYFPKTMNAPSGGFKNSESAATGPLNASQAIWRSSNTFFVHLEEQVGVLKVADMAGRLGITSLPRTGRDKITSRDGSLTLGTYEVSPVQLAGAYASFAAHGVHCDPIAITSITDAHNRQIDVPSAHCHQAISSGVADTVASIMQGTIDGPDSARTGAAMTIGRPAAGKTGTTENNAAVWFSGFTPQYATSVWVGDPRGGFKYPLIGFYANGRYISRAYGSLVAGPIWKEVMSGIHQNKPVRQFPPADPATAAGESLLAPDVRGLSVEQAIQVVAANGFRVRIAGNRAPFDPLFDPDRVASTSPAPGVPIPFDGAVTLTLTFGSKATQSQVPPQDSNHTP